MKIVSHLKKLKSKISILNAINWHLFSTFIVDMDNIEKIAILGCGWLGLPLAKELVQDGFIVNGSTTTESKLPQLASLGINPFLMDLNLIEKSVHLQKFFEVDVLFINLPPTKASNDRNSYADNFEKIITLIEQSIIKKVVFISATSVYENNNDWVKEDSKKTTSNRGQRLIAAENLFLNNNAFKSVIIRFGGLNGNGRNPVKYLSQKSEIEGKDEAVNMIHIQDCMAISKLAILNNNEGVYNAVADQHPTKYQYYNQMAKLYAISAPQFSTKEVKNDFKKVDNSKLKNDFNYEFIYSDPLNFPK